MADNISALVSQFFSPDAVQKIAVAAATDPASVQKLLGAGVPAVMAGMATAAAAPGGAQKISEAIGAQDPALLDNMKAGFGQEGQIDMAMAGSKMLGSLLGDRQLGALTGTLGKFAGTDSETTEAVLGVIGPAVTGVLGQQDPAAWSDGNAIMATLAAQKSNIMAAMPAGLGSMLGAAGMAGGAIAGAGAMLGQAAAAAPAIPPRPAAPLPAPSARAPEPAPAEGGIPFWVYIIGALVVLALIWFLFLRGGEKKVEAPAPAPKPAAAAPAAPAAPAAAVVAALPAPDVTKDAAAALDGLKASLGSVTDAASAAAALPKLTEAGAQLDKVAAAADKLPAEAKKALAATVGAAMPALNAQIDKVGAMAGIDALKPALEAAKAKLAALSKL